MSSLFAPICAATLWAATCPAQSPITLTIDAASPGQAIPAHFAGVSIFTRTQVEGHRGVPGNLFSGTNTQLITLFKNTGLHHLRLGATGSSTSGGQNLSHPDIDSLFAFAKATDIKIIFSLHGNGAADTAKYVWHKYRPFVDYFAFDNEPDGRASRDGGAYFADWRTVAKSVLETVPDARFAGPDAAGRGLAAKFVKEEKDCGHLGLVTQHCYVGGNPRKRGIDAPHAVEQVLSKEWVTSKYPELYSQAIKPVVNEGLPFRITEFDDYVHGVTNVSDSLVTALWALDALHWWAARGTVGIDFQNTEWLPTDTFYLDPSGNYQVRPKAHGIKAFDLGSHGSVVPVALSNADSLNLTAYAVLSPTDLCLTLINKEHGRDGRAAAVKVAMKGFVPSNAGAMFLTAADGNVTATNGVTLGGAPITNDAEWRGEWNALNLNGSHPVAITVPASSAAVVRLRR